MCDVGYLCVNFSLPGLSVLELGPMYATDRRQTKGGATHMKMVGQNRGAAGAEANAEGTIPSPTD